MKKLFEKGKILKIKKYYKKCQFDIKMIIRSFVNIQLTVGLSERISVERNLNKTNKCETFVRNFENTCSKFLREKLFKNSKSKSLKKRKEKRKTNLENFIQD